MELKKYIHRAPWSIICNLLLMYAVYMLLRIVFVAENWQLYSNALNGELIGRMLYGALRFDTSAIIYTNLLYMLLVLLPIHTKEKHWWCVLTKWCYVIPNAIAVIINLMDTVYFPYSMRRTTTSIFREFGDNTNIGNVVGIECINHWYLVLLGLLLIFGIYKLYTNTQAIYPGEKLRTYYIRQSIMLVIAIPLAIMGMRGNSLFHINRPISTMEAIEYIDEPTQAGIVVNTTFSLIRSSSRQLITVPPFYEDLASAEAVFSPVHYPADSLIERRKNLVFILVESLSEEFVGAMYRPQAGDEFNTLTPFIDSLYQASLTFEQTFANGWMSTDGIPLIQASIPKMYYGYHVSPYAMNETPGIAKELSNLGYTSAYFHGAEGASLGLKGASRSTGITNYYGMEEYIADPRFGGKDDYDGTWGIWDEKFMQYFCTKLGDMPEPFFATLFTLNSHHPFSMPKEYEDKFPNDEPEYPVKRCIRYTDYSLQEFFESAKRQPWYDNTLFVITADHCYHNIIREPYRNAIGQFRIPILFFDPSGELPAEVREGVAQQLDIMPTILNYIGYDKPYVAFGKDLFNTPTEDMWAFQYQDLPQYIKGDYLIQMTNYKVTGIYKYKEDFSLRNNLLESGKYDKPYVEQMTRELEAILQSADTRLRENILRKTDITTDAE